MTKRRKASNTSNTTATETIVNMEGMMETTATISDDALLSSMLGDLDEIVEDIPEITESETVEPDALEAAVAEAEKVEAVQELYADDDANEEPILEASDAPTTVESEDKPKKERKAKAPKEPKAPRMTAVTHKPGDRLIAHLGGNKALLTFFKDDDTIAAETRADEFLDKMNDPDAIADKVKEKAIMLITWIASGKDVSALNEVLRRSFTVLFTEGELTSGQKGNLQQNLLSKPYSPGTAASQANQMFMLFPILGITVREKGRMVVNPNSIIAEAMKVKLGLAA